MSEGIFSDVAAHIVTVLNNAECPLEKKKKKKKKKTYTGFKIIFFENKCLFKALVSCNMHWFYLV